MDVGQDWCAIKWSDIRFDYTRESQEINNYWLVWNPGTQVVVVVVFNVWPSPRQIPCFSERDTEQGEWK